MKPVTYLLVILFAVLSVSASSVVVTTDITTNTTWEADTVFID